MFPFACVFVHLLVIRSQIKKMVFINKQSEDVEDLEGMDDHHPNDRVQNSDLLNTLESYYVKHRLLNKLREPTRNEPQKLSDLDEYYKKYYEKNMTTRFDSGGLFTDWYQDFFVNVV